MKIIVVANQKGGCGKTTVAINLAASMAREGQRTLLVDMDPQGHCALGLSVPEEQIQFSMADLLLGRSSLDLDRVIWQISASFDLAPSKLDLSELEQKLAGVPGREDRLRDILQAGRDRYDIIILDTPPNVGILTASALRAADEAIVPVDTGYFALHGLSKQLETVERLTRTTGRPLAVRILPNLYDVRTKLGRTILAELRRRYGHTVLTSFVNFNTKLKECTSLGQPITEYDPASSGCRDFTRLARELLSLNGQPQQAATPQVAVPDALLDRANELAARADALLATAKPLFGSASAQIGDLVAETAQPASGLSAAATPPLPERVTRPAPGAREMVDHAAIEQRIEEAYGVQIQAEGVRFAFHAPQGARSVLLAGDFNGWRPEATALVPNGRNDSYHVRLPLRPGRYMYRYVVDGQWTTDPHNPYVQANPFGELNNVIEVAMAG